MAQSHGHVELSPVHLGVILFQVPRFLSVARSLATISLVRMQDAEGLAARVTKKAECDPTRIEKELVLRLARHHVDDLKKKL